MKKILKRNQIVIFVIALMLIAAGYLSYQGNGNSLDASTYLKDAEEYAGIGDATLVNGDASNLDGEKNENNLDSETIQTGIVSNNDDESTNNNGDYFASSKLGRDTMYSQMSDNYQKILDNTNTTEAQKSVATEEIKNINDVKNAIMICENLIKAKGFEDVVAFVNDNSVNVIVKKDNLTAEEVAQIQNIVSRELGVEVSNIHISNKP